MNLEGDRVVAVTRELDDHDAVEAGLAACDPAVAACAERSLSRTPRLPTSPNGVILGITAGLAPLIRRARVPVEQLGKWVLRPALRLELRLGTPALELAINRASDHPGERLTPARGQPSTPQPRPASAE